MRRFLELFWLFGSRRGLVGWLVVAIAAGIFFATGVSIFRTPPHEVMYSPQWVVGPSLRGSRLAIAVIEIGNTGRKTQKEVTVHFANAVLDRAIMPMTVKNFGVSQRPVTETRTAERTTIALGKLDPGNRVEFKFVLQCPDGEAPPAWEQILLGVEPAAGPALQGHPDVSVFGRLLFSVFGDLLPF